MNNLAMHLMLYSDNLFKEVKILSFFGGRMNHYEWLEKHFMNFLQKVDATIKHIPGLKNMNEGLISSHGDKCYGYKNAWEEAGIPFRHGVAIYLLSYVCPFSEKARETTNGFVSPQDWVIENYCTFKSLLKQLDEKEEKFILQQELQGKPKLPRMH